MHKIQEIIGMPKVKIKKEDGKLTIFSISPLPQGFGSTIGNSMRRSLLSSVPGSAITAVIIDGVSHEYATIEGVKDSAIDIILNLKNLIVRKNELKKQELRLEVNKAGDVFAKQIKCPSSVEILNPDLYITSLSKGGKIGIRIEVEKSVGYSAIEDRKNKEDPNKIFVDAYFSPVVNVKYVVNKIRIDSSVNLEELELSVVTDGSINADEAIQFSANVLKSYFNMFKTLDREIESDFIVDASTLKKREKEELMKKEEIISNRKTPIEILNLSQRTLNSLVGGGITSVEKLANMSETQLKTFRGFGKKALDEVTAALQARGIIFGSSGGNAIKHDNE